LRETRGEIVPLRRRELWDEMTDEPKKATGQDLQDYRKSATGEHIALGTAMCSVHPVHPV